MAYCLHITDVEPIKYGLIFSRFISPGRCFIEDTKIIINDGLKEIKDVVVGDLAINKHGELSVVEETRMFDIAEPLFDVVCGEKVFTCTIDHEWIVENEVGVIVEKQTRDLTTKDKLIQIV